MSSPAKKIKVAIWDDRDEQLEALRQSLLKATQPEVDIELVSCPPKDIAQLVGDLRRCLNSKEPASVPFLDELDVLCIDYDLRLLAGQSWLTADALAGLVHAYSDCPFVSALNRPPRVAFDLTMLAGWDGLADLQTIPEAVSRETFWSELAPGTLQFRPWDWPDVRGLKAAFAQRMSDLEAEKDLSEVDVFEFFGFDKEQTLDFSWRAIGALSTRVRGEDPRLTFADFLREGARSLPPEKLRELSFSDATTRIVAKRLVASELSRWIREQVLAGQDVLVDVPHLIGRAPWLLGQDQSLKNWNSNVLNYPVAWLKEHAFKRESWAGRPCFVWSQVQRDQRFSPIQEGQDSASAPPAYGEYVFLEDASCFADRSQAQSYSASFGNVWDQRYVMEEKMIAHELPYGPQVRFAI